MFGTFSPANLEFTILADIERDWTVFIVILIVGSGQGLVTGWIETLHIQS